jgi:alpha/beta superfamily hydrolase
MTENNIRKYFLEFLVGFKGQALIPRLEGVSCAVGFRIQTGITTSDYSLLLRNGVIDRIQGRRTADEEVRYTTSEETFLRIVGGRLRAERAFLTGKVSIGGNLLRGLKLAFLLQEFFDRFPYQDSREEATDLPTPRVQDETFEFPEGVVEERIEIPFADLSVKAVYPAEGPIRERVILVPPHPYLGGSSDNTLLLRLSSELALRGAFVVRFDYRETLPDRDEQGGDIRSFWEMSDAGFRMGCEDLKRIHEWLQPQTFHGETQVVWIGYSYGAQVCLWAQEDCSPDRQVFISPVASQLGSEKLNCDSPTLLVGGTADFATSTQDFRALEKVFPSESTLSEIEGADHFYSGREEDLIEVVLSYLNLETPSLPLAAEGQLR